MNADFIGGSIRYPDGKWHQNCHQTVYKNYSIHYFPGYIDSENECLICDMFLGPIFGRTEKFKNIRFEERFSNGNVLSSDFFLKVCDSRFHNGNICFCNYVEIGFLS